MLKTIIVDDEIQSIHALEIKLKNCSIEVDIVGKITNPMELPHLLNKHDIDILFLDIEMPGINGLTLINLFKERNFEVIFVTAYNKYAISAIRANALDYLMKPVDKMELQAALEKVVQRKHENKHIDQVDSLSNLLKQLNPPTQKIALNSINAITYVSPEEIIYISGENNYSKFILKDGSQIVVSRTLKEYEDTLANGHFFRAHKSFLINLKHVKQFNKGTELSVTMSNNEMIEISPRRKTLFLKLMNEI